MSLWLRYFFLIILLSSLPSLVFAQLVFTEIMYDLEGADTGREWIELKNEGSTPVDISSYKLRENDVNHSLVFQQGSAAIPSGGYAVVADNATKFLADHPGFTGTLYDSSFSLSNSGETLVFKDVSLADLDTVTYVSDWGGAGDGKSLQKSAENWLAAAPNPAEGPSFGGSNADDASSSDVPPPSSSVPGSTTTASVSWPVEQQIFANAGFDRVVMVGADVFFQGKALGLEKKPLENARYLWNFGDGEIKEGKEVFHAYRYPGAHVVTLSVASGYFSADDRAIITVIPAQVSLTEIVSGNYIEIGNHSTYDLDLSRWQLMAGQDIFVIPDHTIILAGKKIRFSWDVLKFSSLDQSVGFFYPSGAAVVPPSVPFSTSTPEKPKTTPFISAESQRTQIPTSERKAVTVAAALSEAYEPRSQDEQKERSFAAPSELFSNLFNWWTLCFFALIIFSIAGYFFLKFFLPKKSLADEFEILE